MNNTNKEKFEGFVPLMRRFKDNPLWTEKRKFSRAEAWIDLLFKARYSETPKDISDRGESITINEGDVLTSMLTLSKDWRRSRAFVKNFIKTLEKHESILINTMDNRRLIVHIVRFSYFKKLIQYSVQQNEQQTLQQNDNRTTYKKKENKGNKKAAYKQPTTFNTNLWNQAVSIVEERVCSGEEIRSPQIIAMLVYADLLKKQNEANSLNAGLSDNLKSLFKKS